MLEELTKSKLGEGHGGSVLLVVPFSSQAKVDVPINTNSFKKYILRFEHAVYIYED